MKLFNSSHRFAVALPGDAGRTPCYNNAMEFLVRQLITPGAKPDPETDRALADVGFAHVETARQRLQELATSDAERESLLECLPVLMVSLSESATPDGSLINFERYVQSAGDRGGLFRYLASHPRAVEILVKLFVGSQYLTEILLRRPQVLEELTNHKRVAEMKSRPQFIAEARAATAGETTIAGKLDALRRFQHWELLRIGACDSFRLFDLKSVTVQLSLLADSLVQSCVNLLSEDLGVNPAGFVVLAFGKLGGEELNYSSDIDLVFLSNDDSARFWKLGQRVIQALGESTGEGFLYRVDMRLRPWGRSGALVNTVEAHIDYLKNHGQTWEKQALLKARPIAGDLRVGEEFLRQAEPLVFSLPIDVIRQNVRDMKAKIEADLERKGRIWGEVKSGEGSIRDVEFVTQCLQLMHGDGNPAVRSFNTMGGLVRLADHGFLEASEYLHLTTGYVFLRTVEHSLQLMHHKQTHSLPDSRRELMYLARRLDFPSADEFVRYYERHCEAIRRIYQKYVGRSDGEMKSATLGNIVEPAVDHRTMMQATYAQIFSDEEIAEHARLLRKLSAENLVEIQAVEKGDNRWQLTIVGYNHIGELSLICGLLFVYGWNILDGNVFTAVDFEKSESAKTKRGTRTKKPLEQTRKFVNVFTVSPPLEVAPPDIWPRYKADLANLVIMIRSGEGTVAQGELAKRVAGALRDVPGETSALLPVTVEFDNEASAQETVVQIHADDTIGFLYELSNALAIAGIEIEHVLVRSVGNRVADTLFVTNADGGKITDPDRLREVRAAIVLIKHFTHLLPRAPNPEKALLHFREFLVQLFQKDDWVEDLSSLERPDVLQALAKLLGVSDFLWEDFLRLQHDNLFPVVKDIQGLAVAKTRTELATQLQEELRDAADRDESRRRLNAFKDREMFRVDMRHILGHVPEFGSFAEELSDLADVVVEAAFRLCDDALRQRYGTPRLDDDGECPITVFALGKCGGRELGYASDIELMFLYAGNGRTASRDGISTTEYCHKLVGSFSKTIRARQEGIFQVDLRLRPYGRAGSLAVSEEAFRRYFEANGPAWPYERQALVKLRPVAGDEAFGRRIMQIRDELIFTGEPFDVLSMRAMREKQVTQLVEGGTFNAKLSPGGLVDCEYLVQGLQITYGREHPDLRSGNTLAAIHALQQTGVLTSGQSQQLQDAYVFLRRLIDALRMVRGHARDLTVPPTGDEEFHFLARRLGYGFDVKKLQTDLDRHSQRVQDLAELLEDGSQKSEVRGQTPEGG